MQIFNFGRNVRFNPKQHYQPQNEQEVLDILNRHKDGQVRVMGAGHAWNGGIASNDAFLTIEALDQIEIHSEGDSPYVIAGGGVKLERLIKVLTKQNLMVPAMGGIMQQSLAGLASTATHGTGRSSFSHYISQIRIAAYDTNGQAKIFEYKSGDELLAARTAIGTMGVIVSMTIPCVPRYWITEQSKLHTTLEEVLAQETEWPLQQTVVIPYVWKFFSFQRKIGQEPSAGGKFKFGLMRFMDRIAVETLPHVFLKTILLMRNNKNMVIRYYREFLPRFIQGQTVTNPDYKGLTLHTRHHFNFRHVEMEVFIPQPHMSSAFEAIKQVTEWFAGLNAELDPHFAEQLKRVNLFDEVMAAKGTYVLHYTSFIRKVLPDDTLISMTANNQTYYALGFFTYDKEENRAGYYAFTKILAKVMNQLFDARLHWGKHFPLEHKDIARLYPDMEKFKAIAKLVDPKGVFQNDYTKRILGL